ncbi:hypothetical protein SISSUDRAFT_1042279 [Sistotremastrum suecicum HHB10207 ss-3]|uniref:Uncharacterized protein n=1 Tax=Sistotremastrum suecicum HHB10207 ss-3 TaxID=1314776 RepID=A0A166GL10_9AGAM|nr:hypothetical protein SISSUDRAFT_1042279 [Sistotremastrum suecicum HHB10207 ss-3]
MVYLACKDFASVSRIAVILLLIVPGLSNPIEPRSSSRSTSTSTPAPTTHSPSHTTSSTSTCPQLCTIDNGVVRCGCGIFSPPPASSTPTFTPTPSARL